MDNHLYGADFCSLYLYKQPVQELILSLLQLFVMIVLKLIQQNVKIVLKDLDFIIQTKFAESVLLALDNAT